jgi:hypothetical protein
MLAEGSVVIRLRGLLEAYATSEKARCEHYVHLIHFLLDRDMWLAPAAWFGYVSKGYQCEQESHLYERICAEHSSVHSQ